MTTDSSCEHAGGSGVHGQEIDIVSESSLQDLLLKCIAIAAGVGLIAIGISWSLSGQNLR